MSLLCPEVLLLTPLIKYEFVIPASLPLEASKAMGCFIQTHTPCPLQGISEPSLSPGVRSKGLSVDERMDLLSFTWLPPKREKLRLMNKSLLKILQGI